MRHKPLFLTFLLLTSLFSGCLASEDDDKTTLRLATTTSMRDSGLLDILIEDYESSSSFTIEYVSVGTGAALVLGENKDVDALIVHAPELEASFVDQGYGYKRTTITWNRFVLLSPNIESTSIFDAFESIYENETCFISRGDFSGTHHKEQSIWRHLNQTKNLSMIEDANGYRPEGDWYYSIGQGMGAAINMADEKSCATLSDRGTALNFDDQTSLERTEFSDQILFNPYSFLLVSEMDETASNDFLDYLLTDGQLIIDNYTINQESVFYPINELD